MKLSIIERIYCIAILSSYQGTVDVMAKVLDDAKKLALTDEEKETIGYKQEGQAAYWNASKEFETEIDLQKDVRDYISKVIKEKEKEGKVNINEDRAAITLLEKL